MVAIGCLALIVFPLIGLVVGVLIGGTKAMIARAVVGLVLAAALCGLGATALVKASSRE